MTVSRSVLAVGFLAGLALAGCGGSSASAPSGGGASAGSDASTSTLDVVASTDVWADIAKVVGGTDVNVTSFIDNPGQDPHSYEANPRNQLAVAGADVVIENGGGYDDFMQNLLMSSKSKATVINAVDVSGRTAVDGSLNEHVWYDFPTVAKVADTLATSLGEADSSRAATFTANATAFKKQLATLESSEAAAKKSANGTAVAITEPVPGYMLTAMGLVDKTPEKFSESVEEGTDVPPTVLAQTKALFSDHAIKALVYNEQTSGPETEAVLTAAKAANIPAVPVTETLPEGQDYLTWMKANVDAVTAAVSSS